MKRKNVRHSLFSFSSYLCFFLGSAFLVTCSILLFCNSFSIPDTPEFRMRAIATFWNLVFLSLLFTLSYGLWQRWRIHRPVQRILRATDQIAAGDFSVRIEPAAHPLGGSNELDVIIENLNAMAQELSGVETLRTDFIASVSHELKTPLAVIQNDAAMLKSPTLSEEDRIAYAQQIFDTTRQLSALITNILKLNKLENQQIFIERSTYLLNEQLCGCLLQLRIAGTETFGFGNRASGCDNPSGSGAAFPGVEQFAFQCHQIYTGRRENHRASQRTAGHCAGLCPRQRMRHEPRNRAPYF